MRHSLTMIAAAIAVGLGTSAVLADQPNPLATPNTGSPSRPSVAFVAVRASGLHLGMTAAEVTAVMGEATKATGYSDNGTPSKRTLDFAAGPIASRVTLENGRLSAVSLDVFRVNGADLPAFTRVAWPGLVSTAVERALGAPSEVRHLAFFGIALDQLIFRRSGEPDVSLFFVDHRLVAKRVGQGIPVDIFRLILPSPPDSGSRNLSGTAVEVGMRASEVKALYAAATLDVAYRLNGQPAEHAIYQTRSGDSFVSLTFVDNILTEFADIGQLPDGDIFQGR